MKIIKRNAIIITAILFVCAAVYLNWVYNKQEEDLQENSQSAAVILETDGAAELYYEAPVPAVTAASAVSEYFTSARLNRQQARDSAISTLREAAETESASLESINRSVDEITIMAQYSVTEAEMEALIMAKGFEECLVFLNSDSAIVAVSAPETGLSASAVSRITDIVLQETDLNTEQIKIIEVK